MTKSSLFLAVFLFAGCSQQQDQPEPKPIVQVKAMRAELENVQSSVTASATIYPRQQASIASKVTAPIRSLLVKKGDTVAAGQVLARLDNRDLVAQRTEALDRARADAASAQAALAQAEKNLERRQRLYNQGVIPGRDLLATQTEAAQAKANAEVTQKYLDLLQGGAEANGMSQDSPDRMAYLNAQLEFTEIRAPFAGSITDQFLYPGDMAKPEAPIFTIMDLSTAVARAQVPESEIGGVARGESCSFSSKDMPEERASGRVSVVNEAVDPSRRTIEVWCEVPNARNGLRAGLFGSVNISVGKAQPHIVLPESAVQFSEGTDKGVVFVLQDHVAHTREVQAQVIPQGKVEILQGIKPGEEVVVEGGYGLPDGSQVTVAEAQK